MMMRYKLKQEDLDGSYYRLVVDALYYHSLIVTNVFVYERHFTGRDGVVLREL